MKGISCFCLILAACICVSEARYKMRRPLTPPPQQSPQLFKKSWPIAHRMSAGNTIHIGGNYGHKRPVYKPSNYRVRRPPVYNIMPTSWKNKIPVLGEINTHAVLPQRSPVKEFHSMNKVPEYSPEYRPETVVMPPTHRGGMDDDKGAIHTIPAPNLSLADKPYNLVEGNPSENNHEDHVSRHQYSNDGQYHGNHAVHQTGNSQGNLVTNYGYGSLVTSPAPQRNVVSPIPTQNQHYEVTETNDLGSRDYHTVQPTYFTQDFDVTRLVTSPNLDLQTNELFVNNGGVINPLKPGVMNGNVQFPQSETPMQTNLHSSLHVGFPGSAAQAPSSLGQQIPDLHVGHPAPAGPPLSATQLYDLLNSFPHQINDQYTNGQQPHLEQQILHQQLGQLFQPTEEVTGFSQPQMHSFNYDEQANKRQQQQQQQLQEQLQQGTHHQQQQQILIDQDYGSGRVTADYNLEPEVVGSIPIPNNHGNNLNNKEINYRGNEANEQAENHIEYEELNNQRGPNTYFSKVGNEGSISTQFFTTLPNKEAAEKLAALAAAGNVNSHLIGQIRKQQHHQQQQKLDEEQEIQNDEPVPSNHKGADYEVNEPQQDDMAYESQQQNYDDEQQERYEIQEDQQQRYNEQERYEQQQQLAEEQQKKFEQQQQQRHDEQQKQYGQQQYNRQHFRRQQIRQRQELKNRYENQKHSQLQQQDDEDQDEKPEAGRKRPMRIMVPDEEEYTKQSSGRTSVVTENNSEDYDYENSETDVTNSGTTASSAGIRTTYEDSPNSEFGTRLTAKKRQ